MRRGEDGNKKVTSAKFTALTHTCTHVHTPKRVCAAALMRDPEELLGRLLKERGDVETGQAGVWRGARRGRGRGRWRGSFGEELCVSLSSLLVEQLWGGAALWERSRGRFAGAAWKVSLMFVEFRDSQFSTL